MISTARIVIEVSLQRQSIIVTINVKIILHHGLLKTLFFPLNWFLFHKYPHIYQQPLVITSSSPLLAYFIWARYIFNERIQFNFFHTTKLRIKVQTAFDVRVDMCAILWRIVLCFLYYKVVFKVLWIYTYFWSFYFYRQNKHFFIAFMKIDFHFPHSYNRIQILTSLLMNWKIIVFFYFL